MQAYPEILDNRSTRPIPCSWVLFAATVLMVLIFLHANALSADLTLVWGSHRSSDSAGYRIYYGTCSGIYTSRVDVGKVDRFTVRDLDEGRIYYFAVTAYNDQGLDGRFSEEVVYIPAAETSESGVQKIRLKTISVVPAPLVLTSNNF